MPFPSGHRHLLGYNGLLQKNDFFVEMFGFVYETYICRDNSVLQGCFCLKLRHVTIVDMIRSERKTGF